MNQELEIEFKNMLSEDEFYQLCRKFGLKDSSFFKQINDYFDTPSFGLRHKKSALRIRHLNERHDLTLKQPYKDAILEIHQWLSDQESDDMIHSGLIPDGEVKRAIVNLGVSAGSVLHIGELTTCRTQFSFKNGELFLDHSYYSGRNDYELEFEAPNRYTGESIFIQLLSECSIPRRPSKNKILRLYDALQEKGV
ncbi:CYTH domain-containing protein [Sporolactobacillus sp. THM7-4]|nr:CYTH domain-containing protein [Sporolactobacillus sp. THM7-4]